MTKLFYFATGTATAAGALAVAWVAAGHLHGNPLALGMTLLIAAFYAWGVLELWRFHQATRGLQNALQPLNDVSRAAPARLDDWLAGVPGPLRLAVRQRVQDARGALPGPALTPYLAGLLVLLGMLGTFLGMVVTLDGTGLALERATDVQTMRDSLAAPVRGLGLAFGTSVAGVAASAMLGLVSALCRRARSAVALALEEHIAGRLQTFTRSFQHEQTQELAQAQQAAERRARQQLQEAAYTLQQQQAEQLPMLTASLQALAGSVASSLQHSLAESARLAAATMATLQPTVQAAMHGIARETAALHGHLATTVQQQLDATRQGFAAQATAWLDSTAAQAQAQSLALMQTLMQALNEAQARQQAQQDARDEARAAAFSAALLQLGERLEHSAGRLGAGVEAQAQRTIEEVARLASAAAEAPRAAAEVVAELRHQLSTSLAQDNALLDERSRVMATLNTVLAEVQHTSSAQKTAITGLVAASDRWLQQAGARLAEQADAEAARLHAVSAQLSASAVDVASLGEAFHGAVQHFGLGSQALLEQLQQLQASLAHHNTRSDEQLAYYVAQAREVIDLSLLSQKQIVDDLQRLARRAGTEAARDAARAEA